MSETNIDIELNADDLDTSQFWKSRDESTKISLNEKLFRIARIGGSDEFLSLLQTKPTSMNRDDIYWIDLDIVDKSGWSVLIHASFNGHLEIVEHIISHQEERYKQLYGEELITTNDNEIMEEIDKLQLEQTTKNEQETEEEEEEKDNEEETIKNIENKNENLSDTSSELKELKELKWKYIFKEFIRRKVKWNGSTALHLSCARGHESIVKLLINKMIHEYHIQLSHSINAIDYDRATPLHCAVLGKHYNICKLLLINGCIANKCDIRGKTPLHWAQERGLTPYIRLLLQYEKEQIEAATAIATATATATSIATTTTTTTTISIENENRNIETENENRNIEKEKEKVVESIWKQENNNYFSDSNDDKFFEQDSKLLEESILTDNDIFSVVNDEINNENNNNNNNIINHQNNFVYSVQQSNNNIHNNNNQSP
eukprot:184552_1